MWIKITDRLPIEKRYYRIMVSDSTNEVREVNDYFDGTNFTLYKKFVNEWFEEIVNLIIIPYLYTKIILC